MHILKVSFNYTPSITSTQFMSSKSNYAELKGKFVIETIKLARARLDDLQKASSSAACQIFSEEHHWVSRGQVNDTPVFSKSNSQDEKESNNLLRESLLNQNFQNNAGSHLHNMMRANSNSAT